jgi:zinc transport system substrate-binding protein
VEGDSGLTVMVSIMPQKYFVERIGGDRVQVMVMVEPGNSPATYEPKPEQLKALSDAAAYFSIGVPFENVWLAKIAEASQKMLMVDTIADIERMPMAAHHHHEEDEEGEHDHEEGAPDPHVWLSPELVKVQSQAIYEALSKLDPAHEAEYKTNLDAFIADIDQLEADIKATLAGLKSNKFMVFHPAWGYFAHDFGLEQIPVEVGGQEPSAQELANLIEEAKEEGIQVVFAQPEFSTTDAETIAKEIGGEVLLISPLAPDWLANMRTVAQTFADVLNR